MNAFAHAWPDLRRACKQRLLEPDKHKHFWASALITLVGLWFFPPLAAGLVAWLIGLMKEIGDHFWGSGFCRYDMIANACGILCTLIVLPWVRG